MGGSLVDFIKQIEHVVPVFVLVLARTIPLATVPAPIYGMRNIPTSIRMSFAIFFSFFYILMYNPSVKIPAETIAFILMILQELVTGFLFAFAASIIVSAIQSAGEIVDIQAGLSMIMLMNPQTHTQSSALGRLYYQIALMVFIIVGGHLYLLNAYFQSFTLLPIGAFYFGGEALQQLMRITSNIFWIGTQLSLPVLVVLFIVDFSLAMMNRVSPQVNVLELNFAMKPTTSIIIILILLPTLIPVIGHLAERMVSDSKILMTAASKHRHEIVKKYTSPDTWEDIWK